MEYQEKSEMNMIEEMINAIVDKEKVKYKKEIDRLRDVVRTQQNELNELREELDEKDADMFI